MAHKLASPVGPGGTIGIVAPAGPISRDGLEQGLTRLHAWGYRTVVGAAVLEQRGYLAGSDAARAADFNRIWGDPQVDAVLCARGGYGVMRMLEGIDWDLVRRQPKFFCGFSDITALHLAIEREAGLVTFHGPMAVAFGAAERYNGAGLKAALQSATPLGTVPWPGARAGATTPASAPPAPITPASAPPAPVTPAPATPAPVIVNSGVAEGRLIGGNLTLLTAMLGTPWEPDFTDRIVLIEEVDEYPYKVDRMLSQLLLAGKLQQAAGVVFGDSPTCMHGPEGKPSLTLSEVLDDLLRPLGIPVLYGFPCGHTEFRATLPLGVTARLDAGAGMLTILEPALA